jgi:hypothetical protein
MNYGKDMIFVGAQLREILRTLPHGPFDWPLVADTAISIQGLGLDLGELPKRLMFAHDARDAVELEAALCMTNWQCWHLIGDALALHPSEHVDDRAWAGFTQLDRTIGVTYDAPDEGDPAEFTSQLIQARFHWPRIRDPRYNAAITHRNIHSALFDILWGPYVDEVARKVFQPFGVKQSTFREFGDGGGIATWQIRGRGWPYETKMLDVLRFYYATPRIAQGLAQIIEFAAEGADEYGSVWADDEEFAL